MQLKKKKVAKQKVDEEATKAKDNIDQATTNDEVDQAKQQEIQKSIIFNQKWLKIFSKTSN